MTTKAHLEAFHIIDMMMIVAKVGERDVIAHDLPGGTANVRGIAPQGEDAIEEVDVTETGITEIVDVTETATETVIGEGAVDREIGAETDVGVVDHEIGIGSLTPQPRTLKFQLVLILLRFALVPS